LRKKRDKSFRRVLEVIRGPKRFITDSAAFHSFATVSPRIFFQEYFKESRLTVGCSWEENTRSPYLTGLQHKDNSEDNTIA
jgi:hypothetical protein